MDSITLITYTHTDYADIWPLVFHGLSCLPPLKKVFACNASSGMPNYPTELYDGYIFYDDTYTYPQKLLQILKQISTPYVLLVHDIDVFLHIDHDMFKALCNTVVKKQMDRCSLELFPSKEGDMFEGGIRFTRATPDASPVYLSPYDVGPSIWKRSTLQEAMAAFQTETYRTIEFSGIQGFLKEKDIWAVAVSPDYNAIYQISRPFPSFCCFLHILAGGRWYPPHIYQDTTQILWYWFEQFHIDPLIRGFGNGDHLDLRRHT